MNEHGADTTDTRDRLETPTIVHALCVLAFASEIGPYPNALAARSGIRLDLVTKIAGNLQLAGLWTQSTADVSEWMQEDGDINARVLIAQAHVAAGLARRVVTEAGVEYVADDGKLDGVLTQTCRSTPLTDN